MKQFLYPLERARLVNVRLYIIKVCFLKRFKNTPKAFFDDH